MRKFRPSVFRRGFVIWAGEHRDETPRDIFRRKHAADKAHTQDKPQLAGAKHPIAPNFFQQRIDEKDEQKRQPQRHGHVAQRDARGAQTIGRIRGKPADRDGEDQTDDNGARGDVPRRCTLRCGIG